VVVWSWVTCHVIVWWSFIVACGGGGGGGSVVVLSLVMMDKYIKRKLPGHEQPERHSCPCGVIAT